MKFGGNDYEKSIKELKGPIDKEKRGIKEIAQEIYRLGRSNLIQMGHSHEKLCAEILFILNKGDKNDIRRRNRQVRNSINGSKSKRAPRTKTSSKRALQRKDDGTKDTQAKIKVNNSNEGNAEDSSNIG